MNKTSNDKLINCCQNCKNAEDRSGFNDHYCKAYQRLIRAEHYACEHFKAVKTEK